MKTGYNQPMEGAPQAIRELNATATEPAINMARCPSRSPSQPITALAIVDEELFSAGSQESAVRSLIPK